MPELPEVETIRRDLADVLHGAVIKDVKILFSKTASHSAAFFKKQLSGRHLAAIKRRGKLLIFEWGSGVFKNSPVKTEAAKTAKSKTSLLKSENIVYLLIHLKMTGQLIYMDAKQRLAGGHSLTSSNTNKRQQIGNNASTDFNLAVGGSLPNRHTRVFFDFKGGARLYFNDMRKFGYLKIVSADELSKILLKNYGPEPVSRNFSWSALKAALQNRRVSIKAALLNQQVIAGLGNIYVDEVLFLSRIKPQRRANSLKDQEIRKLVISINEIIKSALKYRGTTFSDYRDGAGRRGNFATRLKVYGRGGRPCRLCARPIIKEKMAGRGTHYCAFCQK